MKRLIIFPLAAMLFGCLPEFQKKQIAVVGKAEIEVVPDSFRMTATIRARSRNNEDALQKISSHLARFQSDLPQLEGLEKVEIKTSELSIRPIYENECEKTRRYDEKEVCPVSGQFAEILINVEGSPAIIAGNVFSFLSELGADEVEFSEYFIADRAAIEHQAEQKAFEFAKEKAQRLAKAANVSLLGLVRISGDRYRGESAYFVGAEAEDTIVVTAHRIQAKNLLSIKPPPITIEREVNVVFAIE